MGALSKNVTSLAEVMMKVLEFDVLTVFYRVLITAS